MGRKIDRNYAILIVSSQEQFNTAVKKVIPGGRFNTIEVRKSESAARRELLERAYDIVIIDSPLSDGKATDFLKDIYDKNDMGIIYAVSADKYTKVSAYLVNYGIITVGKPIKDNSLELSIKLLLSMQDKIRESRRQAARLEEKMKELRIISRAKLLLVQNGMSEDEAHEHIIRTAMNTGLSKKAVAEDIIEG